jgi:hypothetical protein
MTMGGSAGLISENALASSTPATAIRACPVFSLNSLRLRRVPGPALALAMVATISPYETSATWSIAYRRGMVACPAQLTMLRFGACR